MTTATKLAECFDLIDECERILNSDLSSRDKYLDIFGTGAWIKANECGAGLVYDEDCKSLDGDARAYVKALVDWRDSLERDALDKAADNAWLERQLRLQIFKQVSRVRGALQSGRFDAARRAIVSQDGCTMLRWTVRRDPLAPISRANPQRPDGWTTLHIRSEPATVTDCADAALTAGVI